MEDDGIPPQGAQPKPGLAARLKELGGALFGGGLISGAIAVVAAVAAIFSQQAASDAKKELDAARLAFDRDRGLRGDQFVIYDRVEKNLSDRGAAGVVMSAAYVTLVDDPKTKAILCRAIRAVADGQVRDGDDKTKVSYSEALKSSAQLMRDCEIDSEFVERVLPGQDVASPEVMQADAGPALPAAIVDIVKGAAGAPPATASQAAAAIAPVSKVTSQAAYTPNGWDVDVFWCTAKGDTAAKLANDIAAALAAVSNRGGQVGGESLGRVRVRSLQPAVATRLNSAGHIVRFDSNERAFAQALANLANGLPSKPGYILSPGVSNTSRYVSIFAC